MRILLFNSLPLLFFFVEQEILTTQKQLDFLERFEPLLKEEPNKTLRLHHTPLNVDDNNKKQVSTYNEIVQTINLGYQQVQEVGFINEQGKILNNIRNSPSLLEQRHHLVNFILKHNSINNDEFKSIFLGGKLHSLKPVHLFNKKSYFVIVWNFQPNSFALYTMILVGIFSIGMFISLHIKSKTKETIAQITEFTHTVDTVIKQTKEQSETYMLQIEQEADQTKKLKKEKKKKPKAKKKKDKDTDENNKKIEKDISSKNNSKLHNRPEDQGYLSLNENLQIPFSQEIGSHLSSTEKKFILIDPVLVEYREMIKPSVIITHEQSDKLRDKTFNPETKDLIRKVIQEVPSSFKDSLKQLNNIQKIFDSMKKSPQLHFLEDIYFSKPSSKKNLKKLDNCLEFLTQSFHADSVIFLNYNFSLTCYEPIAGFGISDEAWKNFYVLKNDSIFLTTTKNDLASIRNMEIVLQVNETMKTDPHFIKRLNKKEISQIKWIYLLPLTFAKINGLIVFFYQKSHEKSQIDHFTSDAENKLNEFLPILRRGIVKDVSTKEKTYQQMIFELKHMISLGIPHIKIIHIRPDQSISVQNFNEQKKIMKKLLQKNERLFYSSPKHLVAYLSSTDVEKLILKLTEVFGAINHEVRKYPGKLSVFDYYLL